jgi:sporulation protein YlmC with PRC-barrel domain
LKPGGYLKLVGEVRDLQIVDVAGRRCGIADEVELSGSVGEKLKISALLVGPGAYSSRLPVWMNALIRIIVGRRVVRIPWEEVKRITSVIELNGAAARYGLGRKDRILEQLLSRIPGARS